ncbi:hypothetical protein ACQ4PT_064286 [Festuca glaucescens]
MLSLYLRLPANSADGDDDAEVVDAYRVFYAIAVVCISICIFCVLVASSSVAVWKACGFAAMAALLLGVVGYFAPKAWIRGRGRPATALLALTVTPGRTREPGCACVLPADVPLPPAFAYGGGKQEATASCVMCSVCLEDVHGGEIVRQLPACRHIFHVECVDMWLQSHRTCPMCRSVIKPPTMLTVKAAAAAAEEAPESSNESLPPV